MLSRRRREGRERGAVAVEAALVTPLLFLLIFGIMEFGTYFKDSLAVSNAVRAGVRIASAEPRTASYAADAAANVAREGSALTMADVEELWVYQANADGTPRGDVGGSFSTCGSCVKFRWEGTGFRVAEDRWPATAHNACQGDPGRMSVGVYLRYRHDTLTGLFADTMTMADHAVMHFEPIPQLREGGCKP